MDFYLFAVKFMVNCQSIYKLPDLKIKNIYFILSNPPVPLKTRVFKN